MNQKVIEILKDLGFEEREIKIYFALIKEDLTALQISKETGIDRTTTYDILEKLIQKGIVSSMVKNKTKNFTALSPKKILMHFKEKYYSLEKIIPELNKINKQNKDPVKCELFQGKEGLKTIIRDLLETNKDYKAIGIRKEYEDILGYLVDQGILKLTELKIKETAIVEKGVTFKKLKHGIYRYLDDKLLPPTTTLIYADVVVFFIWQEPYFAVRIKSKHLAKTQEEYFNLLWKIAKK